MGVPAEPREQTDAPPGGGVGPAEERPSAGGGGGGGGGESCGLAGSDVPAGAGDAAFRDDKVKDGGAVLDENANVDFKVERLPLKGFEEEEEDEVQVSSLLFFLSFFLRSSIGGGWRM